MQSVASHCVRFGGLTLAEAELLANSIENNFSADPLAISQNETDETQQIWEVIAYANSFEAAQIIAESSTQPGAIEELPDVDWVRESLLGLAPVTAGRFFIHGSHDRGARRSGGVSLEIDAGTAFGTGHHGTTAGCLEAFDTLAKAHRFRRVLDLGCGTGVLAIAAARAIPVKVLATDIDREAVRVTLANARLNGAAHRLTGITAAGLHNTAIRKSMPFDLVFANILARPLAKLAHGLSQSMASGGYIVLSGITADQERWIRACYLASGMAFVRSNAKQNWITLVLCKPGRKNARRGAAPGTFALPKGQGWDEA